MYGVSVTLGVHLANFYLVLASWPLAFQAFDLRSCSFPLITLTLSIRVYPKYPITNLIISPKQKFVLAPGTLI